MGKLYTIDNKLLTETPEIRVGEKIYPVDNRQKTAFKIQQLTKDINADNQQERLAQVMELVLGKQAARELDELNLPFPAYQQLFSLLMDAVLGDEESSRFQGKEPV